MFHRENNKLWRRIEEGTLTFPELEKIRWNNVFAALDMDFDGVVFEKYFRTALHESAIPVNGARELLEALRGRYLLAAASNGPYEQQLHRLALALPKRYVIMRFYGQKNCYILFRKNRRNMTISSIKFICSESLSTYETKCKYYRNAYKFRQYFLKLEMLMVQNCGKFKKRKFLLIIVMQSPTF